MSKAPQTPSLFDVEDVQQMPKVRDMRVGPVATSDVREFASRYHYTSTPGLPTWRWGLWHSAVLHGVVAYNLPTRSVCGSVFGDAHLGNVWHMSRLALSDDSPRNSESRLIGGSLRLIEREHPHVWAVITYAAMDAGHIGTVYQATNALYIGTGGHSVSYIDDQGNPRTDYTGGWHVSATKALSLGWTVRDALPKHRYIYILGSRRQRRERCAMLRYEVLPYPKHATDATGSDTSAEANRTDER